MPNEIILPAGTEFVETANIPVLIAEALNPKPANEPRLGRQTELDANEVKAAAFQRYIVEREHMAMMCCAIDDGKLKALKSNSRRRVNANEPDSIVMVSELAKYVKQFEIGVRVEQAALTAKADEIQALKASRKARLERAVVHPGSVSYAPRVDLPTPLKQPDWDYWPHLPTVEPWQACALAFDINPEVGSPDDNLYPGQNFKLWFNRMNADRFNRYTTLAKLLMANLSEKRYFPTSSVTGVYLPEFAAWCIHIGRDIPPELAALAKAAPQAAPAVKGKAGTGTSPSGDDCGGLKKREKQIRAIEKLADELGYQRLAIPDGGRKLLMEKCKEVYHLLFGAGDDPFKEAWADAVKKLRIRMENHESYSRKKVG